MKMLLVLSLSIASLTVCATSRNSKEQTFEEMKESTLKSMTAAMETDKGPIFPKGKACVEGAKTKDDVLNCLNKMQTNTNTP